LTSEGRRYGAVVRPLGFRFDVDAVLVDGIAHREDCDRLPPVIPHEAVSVPAAAVFQAERCPQECPNC
jgi:hypothetical protein